MEKKQPIDLYHMTIRIYIHKNEGDRTIEIAAVFFPLNCAWELSAWFGNIKYDQLH